MKCQILFSEKSNKNITDVSSAEFAQREVKVRQVIEGICNPANYISVI